MKKLFLVAAVLIAALIMSCGGITAPDLTEKAAPAAGSANRSIAFTAVEAEGGYLTLEYAPPAKTSRALSLPLAKAAANFFEVIFVDDETPDKVLSRRSFNEGMVIRMKVKTGIKYNNTTEGFAYMFGGRRENNTLLAVGKISRIDYEAGVADDGIGGSATPPGGSALGDFLINENTFKVTFELEALETDVKNAAASSFRTWATDAAFTAAAGTDSPLVRNIPYGADTIPVFLIPKDDDTTAVIEIATSYYDVIKLGAAATSTNIFDARGFFEMGKDAPMVEVAIEATEAGILSTYDDGELVPATLGIQIPVSIAAPDKDGLGVFSYSVPVFMYTMTGTDALDSAITWYLRGGVTNPLYDLGPEVDSQGGTIVFGIGDVSAILDTISNEEDPDGFIVTPGGTN